MQADLPLMAAFCSVTRLRPRLAPAPLRTRLTRYRGGDGGCSHQPARCESDPATTRSPRHSPATSGPYQAIHVLPTAVFIASPVAFHRLARTKDLPPPVHAQVASISNMTEHRSLRCVF